MWRRFGFVTKRYEAMISLNETNETLMYLDEIMFCLCWPTRVETCVGYHLSSHQFVFDRLTVPTCDLVSQTPWGGVGMEDR